MKKTMSILSAALVLLMFIGCQDVGAKKPAPPQVVPQEKLIGTWEMTVNDQTIGYVFNKDNSYSMIANGVKVDGTYTATSDTITITIKDNPNQIYKYNFIDDQLVLADPKNESIKLFFTRKK